MRRSLTIVIIAMTSVCLVATTAYASPLLMLRLLAPRLAISASRTVAMRSPPLTRSVPSQAVTRSGKRFDRGQDKRRIVIQPRVNFRAERNEHPGSDGQATDGSSDIGYDPRSKPGVQFDFSE